MEAMHFDMFELVVVGPAFFEAFVPSIPFPPPGEEAFVDEIGLGLGGALNAASVAAALGIRTAFMHPRTGWEVDSMVAHCCKVTGIIDMPWGDGGRPFVSLVRSDSRNRSFLSCADWSLFDACPSIPPTLHVHAGGLVEFDLIRGTLERARARGAMVSTCAGWNPPVLARLAREHSCPLDILFMNSDEATCMCGDTARALEFLPGRVAGRIVITLGADGAVASSGNDVVRHPAPTVDVVDTTGAGDAFAAAWIASMIRARRMDVPPDAVEALKLACDVASRVVGIRGGVVMSRDQVTSR